MSAARRKPGENAEMCRHFDLREASNPTLCSYLQQDAPICQAHFFSVSNAVVPTMNEQTPASPAARSSWKLVIAAILLVILPPLLPFPLYLLEQLWIAPTASAAWEQCKAFYCAAAVAPERLGALLVWGPSVFIAVASMFFGYITIERSHRRGAQLRRKKPFYLELAWFLALSGPCFWDVCSVSGGILRVRRCNVQAPQQM